MTVPLILIVVIIGVALFYAAGLRKQIAVSDALSARAHVFSKDGDMNGISLLVLGDSTGVGVGADKPEDTVAARFAGEIAASYVENRAVNGATTKDLPAQIEHAKLPHYSYILIGIGGNDIIRFHRVGKAEDALVHALEKLPKAERVIIYSAGNVGAATFFPWFIRPFHTRLNLAYHKAFAAVAEKYGAHYVNLYEDPSRDPFVRQPTMHLSEDGLHPSSLGYGLWFEKIRSAR